MMDKGVYVCVSVWCVYCVVITVTVLLETVIEVQ